MQNLSLSFNSVNESLQAGDLIFFIPSASSSIGTSGGFDFSNSSPIEVGEVISVNNNEIIVLYDNVANEALQIPPPLSGDYIMFAKNKVVNTSGLKGYYLEAEFKNDSNKYIELFSVGSETTESSK